MLTFSLLLGILCCAVPSCGNGDSNGGDGGCSDGDGDGSADGGGSGDGNGHCDDCAESIGIGKCGRGGSDTTAVALSILLQFQRGKKDLEMSSPPLKGLCERVESDNEKVEMKVKIKIKVKMKIKVRM